MVQGALKMGGWFTSPHRCCKDLTFSGFIFEADRCCYDLTFSGLIFEGDRCCYYFLPLPLLGSSLKQTVAARILPLLGSSLKQTGAAMIFLGLSCWSNCTRLPSSRPTTICLPLGLQQPTETRMHLSRMPYGRRTRSEQVWTCPRGRGLYSEVHTPKRWSHGNTPLVDRQTWLKTLPSSLRWRNLCLCMSRVSALCGDVAGL